MDGTAKPTEIAHVLFLDLVDFSKQPTDLQRDRITELQAVVCGIPSVREARSANEGLCLPTGDGMALVFFRNPVTPAEVAIALARELRERPHLRLRMGIHSGPVQRLQDVNGDDNVAGAGINLAQRVMDCGDAGHILVSKSAGDTLRELSDWAPFLRDLGEFRAKHNVRLRLYNLLRDGAGNPNQPGKRRAMRKELRNRRIAAVFMVTGLAAMFAMTRPAVRDRLAGFPSERYVAMLPFENTTGNPADRALCDGLAEVMSVGLANAVPEGRPLWVAAASDVRRYGVKTISDASAMLGATLAVAGTLERRGEQVHLTLRLIDTTRNRSLGSRQVIGKATQLEALSNSATHELGVLVGIPIAAQVVTKGSRTDTAYEHYLDGEGSLHRFEGPQSVTHAIASFQRAIEIDPSFSQAAAGLADAYIVEYVETKNLHWLALADEQARKAASLPRPTAQVHLTLGWVELETGHPEAAITEFRRALKMEPGNIEAMRNLATAFEKSGRGKDAEAAYQAAVQARPAYWPAHSSLATYYANTGHHKEAEVSFLTVLKLAPQNPLGYRNLGGLYDKMGRHGEAIVMLRKSLDLRPNAAAYSSLGAALFGVKKYGEAAEAMEQAVRLSDDDPMLQYNLADTLWVVDGRREEAVAIYRRAAEMARAQLSVDSRDARLASALAICLARLGEMKAAQEEIRRSLRLAPKNPTVRFKAARVFAITGLRGEASRILAEALAMGSPLGDAELYPELSALRQGHP